VVAASKARLSPARRRFAGVLVDVFYDHLLASRWPRYASRPLPSFTAEVYQQFGAYPGPVPTHAREALRRMAEQDRQGSYATLSGVGLALSRISMRLRQPGLLAGAAAELASLAPAMQKDFDEFYPTLIERVDFWRETEPLPAPATPRA
jgi:acyl carrier protein phosphodiesterase